MSDPILFAGEPFAVGDLWEFPNGVVWRIRFIYEAPLCPAAELVDAESESCEMVIDLLALPHAATRRARN